MEFGEALGRGWPDNPRLRRGDVDNLKPTRVDDSTHAGHDPTTPQGSRNVALCEPRQVCARRRTTLESGSGCPRCQTSVPSARGMITVLTQRQERGSMGCALMIKVWGKGMQLNRRRKVVLAEGPFTNRCGYDDQKRVMVVCERVTG